jgi:hypothetical protein
MSETGYIHSWTMGANAGRIHVCGGDFDGSNVAFLKSSCASSLQATLQDQSISLSRNCPPPNGCLQVEFDFDLVEGDMVAINVRET